MTRRDGELGTARFNGLRPSSSRASSAARGSSKKQGTSCELMVRAALRRLGLRYRTSSALPGRPDLVFARARIAVFCDGDFWHGRDLDARIQRLSVGHNAPYWVAKIKGNVERDDRVNSELRALGWIVLRFWESSIKRDADGVAAEIAAAVAQQIRAAKTKR